MVWPLTLPAVVLAWLRKFVSALLAWFATVIDSDTASRWCPQLRTVVQATKVVTHVPKFGCLAGHFAATLHIPALRGQRVMDWPSPVMVTLLLFVVWINYSLWRARRDNYSRFVPLSSNLQQAPTQPALPPNQRLTVRATGLFSVSGRESRLLLRPAHYWRVPLGDHIIMAEEGPGKFLYQFFDAHSLQELREGLLLFGPQPAATLAVSFLARWGPEYTRFGQVYEAGDHEGPPATT